MALTKEDLRAIEQIVDGRLDKKLAPIHTDIKELRADVSEMKVDAKELRADISEMKKDAKELRADVSEMKVDAKELRADVSEMKKDLRILARIAQLDLIKQEKRLNYLTEE